MCVCKDRKRSRIGSVEFYSVYRGKIVIIVILAANSGLEESIFAFSMDDS